jgi:ubiquitin-conjugating enzyme E2 Z
MTEFISRNTIKRLIRDVKQIKNDPLTSQGIYYKHHEEDVLKGYALLIGPLDTPYENGFYFFELDYPKDYPFSPPKLTFLTQDGATRFNPNLYRNGKVCLSVLNTWRGEQWTSCQNISTVLLTLITIFNNKPLLNEPGVQENHPDFLNYNKILKYKNFEVAIYKIVTNEDNNRIFDLFYDEVNFNKNFKSIKNQLKELKTVDSCIISTSIYNMRINIEYKKLYNKINKIKLK